MAYEERMTMRWTDRYLSPLTENAEIYGAVKKLLKSLRIIVPFGLLPHTEIQDPMEPLPELKGLTESGLKAVEKIYDASLSRIDTLEKKALNLLSYITASFTIIALLYTLFSAYPLRVWLLMPIGTLLLTLFVSFRCLSVKSIFHVFVGDIYRFDGGKPIKKGEELHLSYLRSAIHNEARADETADILRAARMLLVTSMVFLFLVVALMMAHGPDPAVPKQEEIHLKAIARNLSLIDSTLSITSNAIISQNEQKRTVDSLNVLVAQLKKELRAKAKNPGR